MNIFARIFFVLLFSIEIFASEPTGSSGIQLQVEKYQLPNGLTVLMHEDSTAPLVSYQSWFRVGSKNEEPGYTGIAHLFEHMMFKGAKRYTGDQFDVLLQANGANNNAFTNQDYTGYYINGPSSKLELFIDIEADRMESLQVTAENLKVEREVVKEERRMRVDNNPIGSLMEIVYGTSFRVHPYRWPVIGYMEDIERITLEKAQEFFRTYYAPNNAVVAIVGAFNREQAKKWIEKYYAHIPAKKIPERQRPVEPRSEGQRIQRIKKDVQNTTFMISYQAPKVGHEDVYALDLLANIIGQGPSSRLYKRLVYDEQVATGVSVYNQSLQDSGLFQILVELKPGIEYWQPQRSVYGVMWRPSNILVTPVELETAKNQVLKGYVDSLKTVSGKANALVSSETIYGDYQQFFRDLDKYNQVTAEDIRRVAQKYLIASRSSLVVMEPNKKGGRP